MQPQRNCGSLRLSFIFRLKLLRELGITRKKKGTFHKEQYPKQVEAYLEKIKDHFQRKARRYRWNWRPDAGVPPICPQETRKTGQHSHQRQAPCSNWACYGAMRGRVACSAHLQRNDESFCVRRLVWRQIVKEAAKGSVIIMDNASFHKKESLQNLVGKYSQELIFLPPYSPEYNPIEHMWSALNRKVAGCYSSIWLRFTGPECRFKRQLAI